MNYEYVKEVCRVNHISLRTICKEVGISMDGLKRGMENDSLAARYIMPLCKSINTTPNLLFNIKDGQNYGTQTQNGGVGNTQIMESGMAALQEQLREKDKQISRLLSIIEK